MARFISANNILINLDYVTHITIGDDDLVAIFFTTNKGEGRTAHCDKQNASIQKLLSDSVF